MKNTINRGVTLIELLIVIGIISVLAVVMVTLINPAESGRKSRDAKRISDLSTIKRAIDLALADKQEFTAPGSFALGSTTDVTNIDSNGFDISKYLPAIPQDPSYGLGGSINVVDNSCNYSSVGKNTMTYELLTDSANNTYVLRTRFESKSNCSVMEYDGNGTSNYYELGNDPGLDL
ncbi:type II secretion system protein [Patescibacteria group bacterium]